MPPHKNISLTNLLEQDGPAMSSRLSARLIELGLSPDAARQRLSRLPKEACALRGISFPKRTRFIYLRDQFNTKEYYINLYETIMGSNNAYSLAIKSIMCQGGVALRKYFDILCGSPLKLKKHISSTKVLDDLCKCGLLYPTTIDGIGECIVINDYIYNGYQKFVNLKPRLLTENFLLNAIRSWASRMNIVSPRVTKIRDDINSPQFGQFKFDLCGPSYLRPLVKKSGDEVNPGFFVADLILGKDIAEDDVLPFVNKCTTLSGLKNIRPFLPMFIADTFSPEALNACRRQGIIATRPETLFGKDVAQALSDLLKSLSSSLQKASTNHEKIEKIFNNLIKIEGAAGNLRGALFELIVAQLVGSIEGGTVEIGVIVCDKAKNRAEIDVRLIKEKIVNIYECKGHQHDSNTSIEEIEKWLTKSIPTIISSHRQETRFSGCHYKFEFWTCGSISPDAADLLEYHKSISHKYDIGWKDGKEIRKYSKQIKAPGIIKILDEHYFHHPLANI